MNENKLIWFLILAVIFLLGFTIGNVWAEEIAVDDGKYCNLHADCKYKCSYPDSYAHIPGIEDIDPELVTNTLNAPHEGYKGRCYEIEKRQDEFTYEAFYNECLIEKAVCSSKLDACESLRIQNIEPVIKEVEVIKEVPQECPLMEPCKKYSPTGIILISLLIFFLGFGFGWSK